MKRKPTASEVLLAIITVGIALPPAQAIPPRPRMTATVTWLDGASRSGTDWHFQYECRSPGPIVQGGRLSEVVKDFKSRDLKLGGGSQDTPTTIAEGDLARVEIIWKVASGNDTTRGLRVKEIADLQSQKAASGIYSDGITLTLSGGRVLENPRGLQPATGCRDIHFVLGASAVSGLAGAPRYNKVRLGGTGSVSLYGSSPLELGQKEVRSISFGEPGR